MPFAASAALVRLFLNTTNPLPLVVEHAADQSLEHPEPPRLSREMVRLIRAGVKWGLPIANIEE
jgi:hypothetical protein